MKWLKSYKLFESYPPSKFEIQAERKFRKILPDLEDMLSWIGDLGVQYDISKLILEGAFEINISIGKTHKVLNKIKTKEQKSEVVQAVARINDYLNQSGMDFSSAEIGQTIETTRDLGFGPSRHGKREIYSVYDINEVIDLVNSTGDIELNLTWFWNNERDWKE
jgi:hypothetical protein